MIQRDSEHDTSTKKPKTAPVVPPVRPPHKYLPFHPACKLYVCKYVCTVTYKIVICTYVYNHTFQCWLFLKQAIHLI